MVIFILPACTETDPIDTDCSSTLLSTPDNRNIYLKLKLDNRKLHGNEDAMFDALNIKLNGTASLISCEGGVGSPLTFSPVFDSAAIGTPTFQDGIFLDEFKLYSFANSRDYLLVLMKLNVQFTGGRKYVSDEIALRFTYAEIMTDTAASVSFVPLELPASVHWYQESGR